MGASALPPPPHLQDLRPVRPPRVTAAAWVLISLGGIYGAWTFVELLVDHRNETISFVLTAFAFSAVLGFLGWSLLRLNTVGRWITLALCFLMVVGALGPAGCALVFGEPLLALLFLAIGAGPFVFVCFALIKERAVFRPEGELGGLTGSRHRGGAGAHP